MSTVDTTEIAVIIPVYNSERYIADCLASIIGQSLKPREIIIVDDGSTDGTPAILEEFRRLNSCQIITQPNQGQAAARNAGVRLATSPYLAFCDADDVWQPGKLAAQMSLLTQSSANVVFSDATIVNDSGQVFGRHLSIIRPSRGRVYHQLLLGNFVFTSTVVMTKKAFDEVGGFRTEAAYRFVEDYDLWLRLAAKNYFEYVDQPLVNYRRHAGSSSTATRRTAAAAWRLLAQQHPVRVQDRLFQLLGLGRQTAVTVMYSLGLDKVLSPLSRAAR